MDLQNILKKSCRVALGSSAAVFFREEAHLPSQDQAIATATGDGLNVL
jgi:hypothetical protein